MQSNNETEMFKNGHLHIRSLVIFILDTHYKQEGQISAMFYDVVFQR